VYIPKEIYNLSLYIPKEIYLLYTS